MKNNRPEMHQAVANMMQRLEILDKGRITKGLLVTHQLL